MDIWFNCCTMTTSDDLKDIRPFDRSKWMRLLDFFKGLGFKYELPDKIFSGKDD